MNVLPQAHCTLACMYLGWIFSFMGSFSLCRWDDVDFAPVGARRGVLHFARDEREERVVLADADVRDDEDGAERDGLTDLACEAVDAEVGSLFDAVLLAAATDDGVHRKLGPPGQKKSPRACATLDKYTGRPGRPDRPATDRAARPARARRGPLALPSGA